MGWFIIAGIVGIAVFLFIFITQQEEFGEAFCGFLGAIFIVGLIGVFFYFGIGILLPAKAVYETESHPLLALSDHIDTSGHFFLGCGSINSTQEYIFIEQLNKNDYQQSHIPCNRATLRFSSEPRIEQIKCKNPSDIINFFFYTTHTDWYIYIPPDSIVYQFGIDLN